MLTQTEQKVTSENSNTDCDELAQVVNEAVRSVAARRSRLEPSEVSPAPKATMSEANFADVKDGLSDINREISRIRSLGWVGQAALFWCESQSGRHKMELCSALIDTFEITLSITDALRDRIDRLETSISH